MNLQGYSRLSVALLLASIYKEEEVTNSESSRHLPNLTLLLPSSSHLPFPSLSLTLSQPLLLSMWRCECVYVCVVISGVCVSGYEYSEACINVSNTSGICQGFPNWTFSTAYDSMCACVCVCVFLCLSVRVSLCACPCTSAGICHRQHSVYSIKYKYIIAE